VRMSGSTDYLRTQAISRLFLDNIYSIGASWVTMGPHVGQVGLAYGANDMGSVMMEENVVSSAGTTYCLDEAVLCRLIRESGFMPAQRNNTYDDMERWIQSLRRECLDHFVPVGLNHLDHLVTEYLEHYHEERPHQGLGNRPLGGGGPPGDGGGGGGEVVCHPRLGGVLRHYERRSAA
jgi:hypothetical protein